MSKGMTYQTYCKLVKELVSEGKSSGAEKTEQRIAYTKLNASRMRRLDKTIKIQKEAISSVEEICEKLTNSPL